MDKHLRLMVITSKEELRKSKWIMVEDDKEDWLKIANKKWQLVL
jgi:16S rRNA G966 N2-methylase RsmD